MASSTRQHPLRWPALDGLRGLAIVLVVGLHIGLPPLNRGGFLGVELFFVLSGFLITYLLLFEWRQASAIALPRFYLRRFLRLAPAQFVMCLSILGVTLALGGASTKRAAELGAFSSLLYFSNWVKAFGWWNQGPFTHTWSLAIEEQYYLLWPLVLVLFTRRRSLDWILRGTFMLCLATFAARTVLYLQGACNTSYPDGPACPRLYNGLDTRAPALLIGSVCGVLVASGRYWTTRRATSWAYLGTITLLGCSVSFTETARMIGFGLTAVDLMIAGTLMAIVSARPDQWLIRILSMGALRALGRVSYGLYLWHKAIIVLVNGPELGWSRPVEMLVEGVFFTVSTLLSWYLLERPILQMRDHRVTVVIDEPDAELKAA